MSSIRLGKLTRLRALRRATVLQSRISRRLVDEAGIRPNPIDGLGLTAI